MEDYGMLENIKAHSIMVAKTAHLFARNLIEAGIGVSIEKTTAGALMHDIGKTASLDSGRDHSEIGRQICLRHSFYEIAEIVGEHVRLKNYHLNNHFSEKEIVFYSDKRVNHDQIVTLEDRLTYILERYGKNKNNLCTSIKDNFSLCKKIEEKLFGIMNFSVDAVACLVKKEDIWSHH